MATPEGARLVDPLVDPILDDPATSAASTGRLTGSMNEYRGSTAAIPVHHSPTVLSRPASGQQVDQAAIAVLLQILAGEELAESQFPVLLEESHRLIVRRIRGSDAHRIE